MSYHVTFYNYIIDDVNSKDYDKNLPFGGIRKDTPVLHKKRYESNNANKNWQYVSSESCEQNKTKK